jgi:methylthioribose-1-phosphate isomerase
MEFLYNDAAGSSSNNQVVPIKWLESKIQNMRKMAIESGRTLSLDAEDIKVILVDKKELIVKTTNHQTKSINRTNVLLTSAVNIHLATPDIQYTCYNSKTLDQYSQAKTKIKNQMVMMDIAELKNLDARALRILNQSDAILTSQPENLDIQGLFGKLFQIYKDD